ncbi:glycosyltransferase family 4 protein [Aureimonas sp. AU40]|uniref:glycosyltransferase family 4 protein n=1 Tax=Aureimonas sp. AU40 TaxID=1637747 RepID=UPI00078432A0|nr:glycosyltransferase family 4 protein [Aureimonas sp. AU40]
MRLSCIHQGYELYGSDRSFIESVRAIRAAFPEAEIEIVIPREGPLAEALRADGLPPTIEPLWVLRRHSLARLVVTAAIDLPLALWRAVRRMRRADLVYVNTAVVFDHTLVARLFRAKTIIHVHEIPEGGALRVLRALLRWTRAEIVFNSQATKRTYPGLAGQRSHVIYNGVALEAEPQPVKAVAGGPLHILMLGRINRIKGQEVLLDALALLPPASRERLSVRIVGSAFETREPEIELERRIAAAGLGPVVRLLPFQPDPAEHFRWADIVVVPSRLPESLGRVAIEAQAYGRPPIVSDIGGLGEVVEDGRTGWLVPPGNAAALAARIEAILADPAPLAGFAEAGRARFERLFSQSTAADALTGVLRANLARSNRPAPRTGRERSAS